MIGNRHIHRVRYTQQRGNSSACKWRARIFFSKFFTYLATLYIYIRVPLTKKKNRTRPIFRLSRVVSPMNYFEIPDEDSTDSTDNNQSEKERERRVCISIYRIIISHFKIFSEEPLKVDPRQKDRFSGRALGRRERRNESVRAFCT